MGVFMDITWLGHDAFLFETDRGSIISDPYVAGAYGGAVAYKQIEDVADVTMVSHDHPDHGGYKELPGKPEVVKDSGQFNINGISFKGIDTFHDRSSGTKRGPNTVFVFKAEGLTVCHLGDLGHTLDAQKAGEIGAVDILFVPVGGTFTIDHKEAWQVVETLDPKIVFPMHYKTDALDFALDKVGVFLEGKSNIKRIPGSKVTLSTDDLAGDRKIYVFEKHKY